MFSLDDLPIIKIRITEGDLAYNWPQGERDLSSNNRIIRISAGSNNRESTVLKNIAKWLIYTIVI